MIDLIATGVAAIIVILIFIGSELSDISHQLSEINDALVDIRDADSEEDLSQTFATSLRQSAPPTNSAPVRLLPLP
jgi:hypothetical protein